MNELDRKLLRSLNHTSLINKYDSFNTICHVSSSFKHLSTGSYGTVNIHTKLNIKNIPHTDSLVKFGKMCPNCCVAIKKIHCSDENSKFVINEIQINKILTSLPEAYSSNFCKMYSFNSIIDSCGDNCYNLTLQYYHTSLKEYISIMKCIDIKTVLCIMSQLYKIGSILDSLSILFCDIKPGNIMIDFDGKITGSINKIIMIDYGGCRILHDDISHILSSYGTVTQDATVQSTIMYMPVEIAKNDISTTKSDVWSITMIFIELLMCREFMPTYQSLKNYTEESAIKLIKSNEYLQLNYPESVSCLYFMCAKMTQEDLYKFIKLIITDRFTKHYSNHTDILDEILNIIYDGTVIDKNNRHDCFSLYNRILSIKI